MKKVYRIITCITVLTLLIVTAACGSQKTNQVIIPTAEPTIATATAEPTATPTIAPTEAPLPLENKVVMLDPGHGAKFQGAVYSKREEKVLTLQVAQYIKEYIEAQETGLQVYLTREDDTIFSEDVGEDLEHRCELAAQVSADVLVSLHFNATDAHDVNGAMVLVSHEPAVSDACLALGNSILGELESLGLRNRGTLEKNSNDTVNADGTPADYYAINRHCAVRGIPGIIVEHCFMDNETDQAFIDSDENLKLLAQADAIGIMNYFFELEGITAE